MKRNIAVDDFANFKLVGELSSSPDGLTILFEQQTASIKKDEYRTEILSLQQKDGTVRPFCVTSHRNHSAKWSKDGKNVVFVRETNDGSQLCVIPGDGGEAVQLSHFDHGASNPSWSADGQRIYALVSVPEDGHASTFDATENEQSRADRRKDVRTAWENGAKRYRRLYYKRDGEGLSQHRYNQLVELTIESGEVQQLTSNALDVQQFQVSPDGRYLYFIRGRHAESEWWGADLYRIDLDTMEESLVSNDMIFHHIEFSPDGSHLAALAMNENFDLYRSAANLKLFLLRPDGTVVSELTESFPDDLTISTLTDLRTSVRSDHIEWSPDGKFVLCLSSREGKGEVVRFAVDSSTSGGEIVAGGWRDVYAFTQSGDKLAIVYATDTNPSLVHLVDIQSGRARHSRVPQEKMQETHEPFLPTEQAIYNPNVDFISELTLSQPEPFWYQSTDGWWVQGWVMRPADFTAGKTYPVILEIHGGPQMNYGYAMFHEMQWFASKGYAVVYTNPRGSKSYGQSFVNAVRQHYGEMDAADVLAGLDTALNRFDFLDSNRVAVTGGSYGGFMTNWLVGHSHRFFAAVSQRSISNWVSFFGCSDIGPLFVESQLTDKGVDDLQRLWEMSPLCFAGSVETPILLLHSEEDLRCPMEQAEQFYTWLRHAGKEAELLRIPNASHGLSRNGKPSLRIQRLEAIYEYIERHLPASESSNAQ